MDLLLYDFAVVFFTENPNIVYKENLITISNHQKCLSTDIIAFNLNTTFKNNDSQMDRKLP